MKLLLIEDSSTVTSILQEVSSVLDIQLLSANNLQDASNLISSEELEIDAALCDLKIPSIPGGIDLSSDHGLTVVQNLIAAYPGVPVVVLSAFGTINIVSSMLVQATRKDIFGTGTEFPMLQYFEKLDILNSLDVVRTMKSNLDSLAEIEVTTPESLNQYQARTLRILARRRDGNLVSYQGLSGGLSGALTGIVTVKDRAGAQVARVVGKITTVKRATEEQRRYSLCITGQLKAGTFADLSEQVMAGCSSTAALFYSVAEDYKDDLFSLVIKDESLAARSVQTLAANLQPWRRNVPHTSKTWKDIRDELISMRGYAQVSEKHDIVEVNESRKFQAIWSVQHGDLHGANVLVDTSGRPVLIDFGRSGRATSCLDPLTMELSVLFHRESPFRNHEWPSLEQLRHWENLEEYLIGCPYPNFLRSCREWAIESSVAERDLFATVNAYCLRNLQYADVDASRALTLQKHAAERMNFSY